MYKFVVLVGLAIVIAFLAEKLFDLPPTASIPGAVFGLVVFIVIFGIIRSRTDES